MLFINLLILFQLQSVNQNYFQDTEFTVKYNELIELTDDNMLNNPDNALHFCKTALTLASSVNDTWAIINAKIMLSNIYRKQSFFDLAFEVTCDAYDMCPNVNSVLRARTCLEKAMIYRNFSDKKKALKFVKEAQKIYKIKGDSLGIAKTLNCTGLIFLKNSENNRATIFFSRALKIYEELNYLDGIATELNNITVSSDNYKENIKSLNRAIRINKTAYNLWSLGENYNNLGTQYISLKNYDKALMFLDVALKYSNIVNTPELVLDNYEYRRKLYLELNNYKEAYSYLHKYYELKNSLPSIRKLSDIEMMLAERKIFTQKRELKLQEQTLTIQKQQKLVVFILLGAICFILSILVYIIKYRNRKNLLAQQLINENDKLVAETNYKTVANELKLLESELSNNKRELTNLAFHIKSRNDILNKIKEQIKSVSVISPSKIQVELKKINLFISQYHKKNNSLKQTISDIDNISTEYVSRLKVKHPNLTQNQIVLASLLRIDLTSKEIALLIDSSAKTVNMARYRLRKQLCLDSDSSLNEYLKKV